MRKRLTLLVLFAALLTITPGCALYYGFGKLTGLIKPPILDTSPATPPSDFRFSIRVHDVANPATDYQYEFTRSGKCTYDVTVRSPRRKHDDGEFEVTEDQIVGLWRAVHDERFEDLSATYPTSGDGPDRTQGVQRFYVFAGQCDWTVESRFQSVASLEKIRAVALSAVPESIQRAENSESGSRPVEFIADTTTHMFHVPDCSKLKDVPAQQRQTFKTQYDALDFQYQPCPDCRPMRTSSSPTTTKPK